MNCKKCGTVNAPNATFCVGCGESLNVNNVQPAAPVAPAPAPVAPAPVAPVQPAAPEMPALATPAPAPAVQPAVPEVPAAPASVAPAPAPVQPAVTEVPAAPAPVAPAPVAPETSVAPTQPVAPAAPTEPVAQPGFTQAAPVAPAPGQPVMPAQPAAPVQPVPGAKENPFKKLLSNKKVLIPIIALLVVIIGVVVFLLISGSGGKATEKDAAKLILDPKKPVMIEKDDKYGYITYKGKDLISATYDYASEFYGGYAVVGMENTDSDTSSYADYKYQVINQKGKEQLEKEVLLEPEYYPEYGIWVIDSKLYNSKLKAVTKEDVSVSYLGAGYLSYTDFNKSKAGIMDYKGKSIWHTDEVGITADLEPNYYDEKDLYVVVHNYISDNNEKWELVSTKKKKVVYTLDSNNGDSLELEDNGIVTIEDDDYDTHTWMYFKDGKLKYELKDTELEELIVYDYENQILKLDYGYDYDEYEYVYKYYDVKNEKMLDEPPVEMDSEDDEDLYELTYGFKKFESSDKYGLMAGDKILVPSEYDDIEFLSIVPFTYMKEFKSKELVIFEKNDQMILYNVKAKKEIATFDAGYVTDSETSSFLKFSKKDDDYDTIGYIIYNLISGKQIEVSEDTDVSLRSNYVIVENDDKKVYYNTDLEKIYEE